MRNHRTWGKPPYKVAVIHGGPGTPGSVAPVAMELSKDTGIIEPFQTKNSVEGQLAELVEILKEQSDLPVILVGHSWGAVLSYLVTARLPRIVKQLILIGMPPLNAKDLPDIRAIWLSRLSEKERIEFLALENFTWDGKEGDKSGSMARLFRLIARADSYAPVACKDETLEYQLEINISVGLELRKLQESGELAEMGRLITCAVTAIHGDYDPRPAAAVNGPLSGVIKDFKFILLKKCGHFPWMEKYARDEFFKVLRGEIAS